ncbi:hypothetical protein ACPCUV_27195 [Streptomyces platensis]|uniref:hypothetical protein n=1 Tax=Streptomyces platensis TaxID=58346 RepID=UPI003C2E91CA
MMAPNSEAPFPPPPTQEWQEKFTNAVLATPGVNVPRPAVEAIAPFVSRPKDLITRATQNVPAQLRPERVRSISTSAGSMVVMTVPLVGYAGMVWERNERQSTAWQSPANPISGPARALPPLRSWTVHSAQGVEMAFAALRTQFSTRADLIAVVERAVNELSTRDGDRPYDLQEDLALNGQIEPCLYVAQQAVIDEADASESGEAKQDFWGWAAVRGNNRTMARQSLFGLTSAEVLAGVPMEKLGMGGRDVSVNPSFWSKKISEQFNEGYRRAVADDDVSARAYRARMVAVVDADLVIGSPTPKRLYQIVQTSNRRDHVHPPLQFKPNDRARALGRTIIAAYVNEGILDPVTADVLTGDLPTSELPGMPADAPVSIQRDFRSMRLLTEFFPTERETTRRRAIRAALSEPPPSQLSRDHVNQRLRAWSALTSVSFSTPWNPRVADVLDVKTAREGITLSERTLTQLLNDAETDVVAFDELLLYRAPNWLAAFDIVEADRGSMGAQRVHAAASEDEDGEEIALRIRRGTANALKAMRADRTRAVGLLREIAATMDEGREQPRKIDSDGDTAEGEADRDWFNEAFPKAAAVRGRIVVKADPGTTAPPPESDTVAVARLLREIAATIDGLQEGVKLVPEFLDEVRAHAQAAGIGRPLPETRAAELVVQLTQISIDLRELPEMVLSLGREAG